MNETENKRNCPKGQFSFIIAEEQAVGLYDGLAGAKVKRRLQGA
jgi:hypothetical protein